MRLLKQTKVRKAVERFDIHVHCVFVMESIFDFCVVNEIRKRSMLCRLLESHVLWTMRGRNEMPTVKCTPPPPFSRAIKITCQRSSLSQFISLESSFSFYRENIPKGVLTTFLGPNESLSNNVLLRPGVGRTQFLRHAGTRRRINVFLRLGQIRTSRQLSYRPKVGRPLSVRERLAEWLTTLWPQSTMSSRLDLYHKALLECHTAKYKIL